MNLIIVFLRNLIHWWVFFFVVFCYQDASFANPLASQLTPSQTDKIANQPTWLKLLHFDHKGDKSEVLSSEFFLSPVGQQDPKAELLATINAYFDPWPSTNNNLHARCQFPARYFWLSKQMSLPNYSLHDSRCEKFEGWGGLDDVKSISLLMVSGYLGNPASMFGHSLLKLNTNSIDDRASFFDLTVNYGALIPDNEPTWRYIFFGITGGYQAGFSDKYYYAQDLVYSRIEFRDIWDYELNLTDYERTLLILHLWEIIGKKYKYYFLDKNCAYRITELLELIIKDPLLENAKIWYAPVETFHRLQTIDTKRNHNNQSKLINSVSFIPSRQRKLYYQFGLLSNKQKLAVEQLIKYGPESIPKHLPQFEKEKQFEILDTLLAYYKYRLVAKEATDNLEKQAIKNKILLAQLELPPQTKAIPTVPAIDSPTTGNHPLLMSIGAGHDATDGSYIKIRWSPFSQEIVGKNYLKNDELVVLDTVVGIGRHSHNLFIDNFDLIRIKKIKTDNISIDEENPWSWQLRIGTTRIEENNRPKNDGIFSFGAGRAWQLNKNITSYTMVDVAAHTIKPYGRLRPHLGVILEKNKLKSWLYAGVETVDYDGNVEMICGGKIQYNISSQFALLVDVSSEASNKISAELKWYW